MNALRVFTLSPTDILRQTLFLEATLFYVILLEVLLATAPKLPRIPP